MIESLLKGLAVLEREALDAVATAGDADTLEQVRILYLGRKDGKVSAILRALAELDPEIRPRVGSEANRVRDVIRDALERRTTELTALAGRPREGPDDLTLPGRARWVGGLHPVTRVIDEICRIFASLGFTRARGPEAETEWYNFVALNTPLDHPAADMQATLYLSGNILLRSHTSPVQVRVMERHQPPIRILAPGMVYRRDAPDASHLPAFSQIEGLAVDGGVTFVDLKAVLGEFAHRFFGPETRVRFRPSFFPFTEPSAEVDVSCIICGGSGCAACKGTGWMEIMGAGMVDPAVFEAVGYDPQRYTGYAFGMGPHRIALLKYGIPDIRLFHENDVRFLEQFR
ncbi:MAG: phenylalanine--tRNA ligase subunit alpha [Gemmatimonadetes bacterium]|nr:phenylalanine--tRNA ligase subunit alpha [Gemmatimonadota bacterium]